MPFIVQTRLSYELQFPMTTVHAPVHEGEDLLVTELCSPHFVAGQTAVLLPTDGHHALQVQLCNLPLGMVSVKAVVQAGEHLLPLVLQSLVLASQHSQGQHNEQHQDQSASDGNRYHGCAEPQFSGGSQLLNLRDEVSAAVMLIPVSLS